VACSGKAATMGFGCHVEVTHNEGKRSFYAHLQERSAIVEDGDFVCRGERLALVGKTGLKRPKPNEPPGPGNPEPTCHIHFQMQDGNITKNSTKTIDPAPLRGFGPISPPANCADLPSIEFCQSLTSFPSGRHFTACGERDCCGQGGPQ
jgi:murein DD-endopeptidase MepM/ murein hydrolase activator NlpD